MSDFDCDRYNYLHVDRDRRLRLDVSWQFGSYVEDWVEACNSCDRYVLRCPWWGHTQQYCHARQVIYIDGACADNGNSGAQGGIGFAIGREDSQQRGMKVTRRLDDQRHTNERADILAAIEGLKFMMNDFNNRSYRSPCQEKSVEWVLLCNSQQIVDNMTGRYDTWSENGWKRTNGQTPANLDLWHKLDDFVEHAFTRHDIKIAFCKILARDNGEADTLAFNAAR